MYNISQLNEFLIPELQDIAASLKISISQKTDKQGLITAILDKQNNMSTDKTNPEEKPKRKRIVKSNSEETIVTPTQTIVVETPLVETPVVETPERREPISKLRKAQSIEKKLNKAEKKTANQQIEISKLQKEQIQIILKSKVLVQYETYKEKKSLVEFQKITMEDDIAAYESAQKKFKDDLITLEELNNIYKSSIQGKAALVSKEKDLNISIIQLEEIIGVKLETVFTK